MRHPVHLLLAVLVVLGSVWFAVGRSSPEDRSAAIAPAIGTVTWTGVVTRSLAGGRGLEIRSDDAPGGYFFAYWDDDRPSSASGTVRISGRVLGESCEYGRCAPEVDIESIF